MAPRLTPLSGQVIVITGATSGVGLTTARMAARQRSRESTVHESPRTRFLPRAAGTLRGLCWREVRSWRHGH